MNKFIRNILSQVEKSLYIMPAALEALLQPSKYVHFKPTPMCLLLSPTLLNFTL